MLRNAALNCQTRRASKNGFTGGNAHQNEVAQKRSGLAVAVYLVNILLVDAEAKQEGGYVLLCFSHFPENESFYLGQKSTRLPPTALQWSQMSRPSVTREKRE